MVRPIFLYLRSTTMGGPTAAAAAGGPVIHTSAAPQKQRSILTPSPSKQKNPNNKLPTPRRNALLLLSLPALIPALANPPSSSAFTLGIPGPKEWLKDQKKKASRFVLAPIEASRLSLRTAYLSLSTPSESSEGNSEEIRSLLNSARRDCVPETRNSMVAFQASTGVEVCTFSLIVNNAASLLDARDPVKLEAESRLGDLVRSFTFLGTIMDSSDFQLTSDREKVKDGLMDAISALDKFEHSIKDCLGV